MSSSVRTFAFAAVTCIVCSLLLTGAATGLKPLQELNIKIDKQKNVLKAVGLLETGQKYKKKDIERLYTDNVRDLWVTPDGRLSETQEDGYLPIHVVFKNDVILSYAMPTSGYGLWSTLYGYIALEGDGKTVKGFTIYAHKETPGLGGEADKPWFQNQFIGKEIVDDRGDFVSVRIMKGKAADTVPPSQLKHAVDGMSGATITTKGIDTFLYNDLKAYDVFSSTLRRGRP